MCKVDPFTLPVGNVLIIRTGVSGIVYHNYKTKSKEEYSSSFKLPYCGTAILLAPLHGSQYESSVRGGMIWEFC